MPRPSLPTTGRRSPLGLVLACLAIPLGSCSELTESEPLHVTLGQPVDAPWPSSIAVQGIDTIEVSLVDPTGSPVRVLGIQWASTDPNVVSVAAAQPAGVTIDDSLLVASHAVITGHSSGTSEIVVTLDRRGLQPAEYRASISVSPLRIQQDAWPVELPVHDAVTLTVQFADSGSTLVRGSDVEWRSLDEKRLTVGKLARDSSSAVAVAQGRGWARIAVTVDRVGFEKAEYVDSIRIMERWSEVSVGASHRCGVTVDGEALCWGSGALGNGLSSGSAVPVTVGLGNLTFRSVSAGRNQSCGLEESGLLICWGFNRWGEVGTGTFAPGVLSPVQVGLGSFEQVSTGSQHTCGRTEVFTDRGESIMGVVCWGLASWGQLGHGLTSFENCLSGRGPGGLLAGERYDGEELLCQAAPGEPVQDPNLPGTTTIAGFSTISSGEFHSCGISGVFTLCWGSGESGQLGVPEGYSLETCTIVFGYDFMGLADSRNFTIPCSTRGFQVNEGNSPFFVRVTAGGHHTCGLTSDGTPWCWGRAEYGQTGAAATGSCAIESLSFDMPAQDTECSPAPVPVDDGLTFASIDAGGAHTCALDFDGRAYCWGANPAGQDVCTILYQRDTADRPCSRAPVLVSDALHFLQLSAGLEGTTCGVTPTDNTIYCWEGFGPAASPPYRIPEPAPRR